MKKAIGIVVILSLTSVFTVCAQEKILKPAGIFPVPDISAKEYQKLYEQIDNTLNTEDGIKLEREMDNNPIFKQFYSPACSWYCGGVIDTVWASSSLAPSGAISYNAGNLHDFNHYTAWAEGIDGDGIGEYIIYEFPGNCPRITTVNILNGYVKNAQLWKANSRVKKLRVYYNNTPLAILQLEDSRSLQWFNIGLVGYGPNGKESDKWTLKFEILEIYPGDKYHDTVISDIYFDGIDVH